jgi:ATP-dependent exoDNAse (exonuclease V) alpha subunit
MMLQRNLLYTAITKAKKLVVLVGTRGDGYGYPQQQGDQALHQSGEATSG